MRTANFFLPNFGKLTEILAAPAMQWWFDTRKVFFANLITKPLPSDRDGRFHAEGAQPAAELVARLTEAAC